MIIIYILLFLIGVFLFQLLNKKEKLTISATDSSIILDNEKSIPVEDQKVIDYLLVYLMNFFNIFENTYEEFKNDLNACSATFQSPSVWKPNLAIWRYITVWFRAPCYGAAIYIVPARLSIASLESIGLYDSSYHDLTTTVSDYISVYTVQTYTAMTLIYIDWVAYFGRRLRFEYMSGPRILLSLSRAAWSIILYSLESLMNDIIDGHYRHHQLDMYILALSYLLWIFRDGIQSCLMDELKLQPEPQPIGIVGENNIFSGDTITANGGQSGVKTDDEMIGEMVSEFQMHSSIYNKLSNNQALTADLKEYIGEKINQSKEKINNTDKEVYINKNDTDGTDEVSVTLNDSHVKYTVPITVTHENNIEIAPYSYNLLKTITDMQKLKILYFFNTLIDNDMKTSDELKVLNDYINKGQSNGYGAIPRINSAVEVLEYETANIEILKAVNLIINLP